jgi:hypothetical protein
MRVGQAPHDHVIIVFPFDGEEYMVRCIGRSIVLGWVMVASAIGMAQAQGAFPNRPITMVVPLPAGGTADLLCRFAAEKASGVLGQQVVIDNRAGGGGVRHSRHGADQRARDLPADRARPRRASR